MTEGLAPVPSAAPAAPAPVAEAPRQTVDSFDSWLTTSRSSGTELATRTEPGLSQQTTAPAQEATAETMSDSDVAALDQHWTALRSAVRPDMVPAFAQAVQSGELPQQLMGAVVRFSHGGQEVTAPVHELVRGNMRLRDYSRRMNEVRTQQQQLDATIQNLSQMFATWDRPADMLASMRRLGKWDQFQGAAMELARERLRESRMTPEQRQAKRMQENLAERERQVNERIAALEARQRGEQQNAKTSSIAQALDAWTPAAFQRHQIPDIPIALQWFQANLDNLWVFGDLTPELVDDAAALTAGQYREAMRAHQAGQQVAQQVAQQQPGGPRPLPVQSLPGNAGAIPAQATRRRMSDFDDHLKAQRR